MSDQTPYNATLIERQDIHETLAIFKVKYNTVETPDFIPGQFTTLGLVDPDALNAPPPNPNSPAARRRRGPKLIRRAYSIASPTDIKTHLEFYIVRGTEGRLTPLLWELKPGDPVFMDEKIKGHFTLEGIPDGKDLVMVCTGTGLGPFMSMLQTYRATGRWRSLILIEGCRHARDLGYHDTLTKLATEDGSVIYLPTVTREPDDAPWQGLRGRVHELLKPDTFQKHTGLPLDPNQCHALLCGGPQMIDQAAEHLTGLGFITQDREHPDGNLHFERYW
tara:strand:- start:559 stop:1389 length:831 start_codon:yes stop_codon:yes gene_type:complete